MTSRFPPNIESTRSPIGDHRAAYACGIVWHVTGKTGDWTARPAPVNRATTDRQRRIARSVPTLCAPTLNALGASLANLTEMARDAGLMERTP